MAVETAPIKLYDQFSLENTVDYIDSVQLDSGLIPWYEGGTADPWDHVESAMGLSIGGRFESARKAYLWMAENQLADGSWWSGYDTDGHPVDRIRESHRSAYVATGVWHHYLITGNENFLRTMWPTVRRALDFALGLQTKHGEVEWAINEDGKIDHDALLTGSCSIYKSLECGLHIARTINRDWDGWAFARKRLGRAIRNQKDRFDRTWESKDRYSMNWFYPVLSGVYTGVPAQLRMSEYWNDFVESGLGCRCVSDEPWVTVAETSELILALEATGNHQEATTLYSWLHQWKDDDGGYWTGYQMDEDVLWPEEKPTWTAAAVLLAGDAISDTTPASKLFSPYSMLTAASSMANTVNNEQ
jgi:hypothetical protein